jgi:hypothetical protein
MSNGDIRISLKIDNLAFTVGVDDDCKEGITSQILDGINDSDPIFIPVPKKKRIPGYRFTYQFELDDSQNSYCKISIGPNNDSYAFFRFEFNPSKVGRNGYEKLNDVLTYLLDTSSVDHLSMATITRLDIAIDIQGRRPSELIIFAGGFGKFGTVNNNHSSEIETNYFGHSEGNRQFCVYDKQVEQREKYGIQIPPTTRFEVKLRRRMHPIELRSLRSKFNVIRIIDGHGLPDPTQLSMTANFLLSHVRLYGTGATLRVIDSPSQRRQWRRRLLDLGEAEWWDHDAIWNNNWPDAINPILRLFGMHELPVTRRVRRRRRSRTARGR